MAENSDKALRKKIQEMLTSAKHAEASGQAMVLLFPKVGGVLDNFLSTDMDIRERRRARRLSIKDFAPSYFQLEPQGVHWGRTEIEELLEMSDPKAALVRADNRIEQALENDRPRLRHQLFDALGAVFGTSRQINEEWLIAFLDFSPKYIAVRDVDKNSIFTIENIMRLRWLIIEALKHLDHADRVAVLRKAISKSIDISVLSDVVRSALKDLRPDGVSSGSEVFDLGDDGEAIRQELLDRVRAMAADKSIWSQVEPAYILWFWWGCGLDDEVRESTSNAMISTGSTLSLMNAIISEVRSTAGNYERVNRASYSKIVDIDRLTDIARVFATSEDHIQQIAGRRFLKAIEKDKSR